MSVKELIKFKPKLIGPIFKPVIIVGEKPGRTRDNTTYSLVGNRTGDFVQEAIQDRTNIILTNVYNVLHQGEFDNQYVADGVLELIELVETHEPRKIITLGAEAMRWVSSIKVENIELWGMPHPSWINRFQNKNRYDYIKQLRHELIK